MIHAARVMRVVPLIGAAALVMLAAVALARVAVPLPFVDRFLVPAGLLATMVSGTVVSAVLLDRTPRLTATAVRRLLPVRLSAAIVALGVPLIALLAAGDGGFAVAVARGHLLFTALGILAVRAINAALFWLAPVVYGLCTWVAGVDEHLQVRPWAWALADAWDGGAWLGTWVLVAAALVITAIPWRRE
ncbi:hypothetical protein [Homoserinibacter sp. GY 40078]|uniref:hypothetical protein n=1 Tax=Homoserinibacter sp. GY 40078 TaxID=2603275 RepID=UPI0011CB03E9|nr:hypothetical protein [Homoserinibacter sp. GY 40078]TXK19793.1 hypothetical protein FVQ89_08015 [Homoserinibacter sp. GY 40078]